jgi:hypothetical protein
MSQPQFEDGPPVPLMTEGHIDAATLNQLALDLLTVAEVSEVREKSAPGSYAAPDNPPLRTALDRLATGETSAVQVRYRLGGHEWSDTIM